MAFPFPDSQMDDVADPDFCRVCFDPTSEDDNPIIFCDANVENPQCKNAFHLDCYFRSIMPRGKSQVFIDKSDI